jgi:nucleoid DNA-binding protein
MATSKKAPAKKAAANKKTAAAKPATAVRKTTAVTERFTKTQIISDIAENTELSKKQVQSVLDELNLLIDRHIRKRAVGEFVLPGILKIQTVKKPAVKARKGTNPFTGEEMMFKAKPASTAVKVRALSKLKEMAL